MLFVPVSMSNLLRNLVNRGMIWGVRGAGGREREMRKERGVPFRYVDSQSPASLLRSALKVDLQE